MRPANSAVPVPSLGQADECDAGSIGEYEMLVHVPRSEPGPGRRGYAMCDDDRRRGVVTVRSHITTTGESWRGYREIPPHAAAPGGARRHMDCSVPEYARGGHLPHNLNRSV